MFQFAFDEALFAFQFHGPSLTPLFQLPPTIRRIGPKTRGERGKSQVDDQVPG